MPSSKNPAIAESFLTGDPRITHSLGKGDLMKSITQNYANEELQKSIQERIQAQIKEKVEKTIASNLLKASLFSEKPTPAHLLMHPLREHHLRCTFHNEMRMGRADAGRGYFYAGNLHNLNPFAAGGKEYREAT